MPSPFRPEQLSPQMRARYGFDRRRWVAPVVFAVTAALVLASVIGLTALRRSTSVDVTLIAWEEFTDHATVVFEVRRPGGQGVTCVVRGQDRTRTDVGYATVDVPAGEAITVVEFALATLMPAYTIEVLGCSVDGNPRVPPPQFPPGVVAPEQPFAG